jgi:hypothetical protein
MNLKNLSLILFSLALICTAVGAVFVYTSKADAARALARKADAEETIAREAARKAKAEELAAASLAKAKESEAKTAEENRKAEEARLETEKAAESRAKLEAEKSRNDREKVAAEYEKAKALKDAETAQLMVRRSYSLRTVTLLGVLAVGMIVDWFEPFAVAIPLLFPGLTIHAMRLLGFYKPQEEE